MSLITYADLSSMEQDAVAEARLLVQKSLPVKPGINEEDVWAVFVNDTVQATNLYPPMTNFATGTEPAEWFAPIVMGIRCQAYKYMETFWTETPDLSTAGVPYANREKYMERWKTLFDQMWPLYRQSLGNLKQKYFHNASLLVSTYQPDVLLRGMWEWPRFWRY